MCDGKSDCLNGADESETVCKGMRFFEARLVVILKCAVLKRHDENDLLTNIGPFFNVAYISF